MARPAVRASGTADASTRACLAAGPLGAVLFVVVFTVEGVLRPGYDAVAHPISALALGHRGWVQDVDFAVFALSAVVFARGMRDRMPSGIGAHAVPRLMDGAAASLLVLAVCPQDAVSGYQPDHVPVVAHSVVGTVHIVVSAVLATLLVVHCVVLSRRFAAEPGGRAWTLLSAGAAVVVSVLVVAYVLVQRVGGPAGVLERAAVVVMAGHGALVATRLTRRGPG